MRGTKELFIRAPFTRTRRPCHSWRTRGTGVSPVLAATEFTRSAASLTHAFLIVLFFISGANAASDETFRIPTDNIPQAHISGELWRAGEKPRGTVFMCHGFRRSMWDYRGYRWIAEKENFHVVRFDFRNHGASSGGWGLPTLGYYEIYDLKAVIDWAEAKGLERPYLCYGHSMGAAIALRWAGEDHRITGVLAQSPFRNALDAIDQFRPDDARVRFAANVFVHGGMKKMLREVDISTAVAKRDDLLIWLTAGDRDYFGETDQRAILAASASPDSFKQFKLIPGSHHTQMRWEGNDALIRTFLAAATARPRSPWIIPTAATTSAAGSVIIAILIRRHIGLKRAGSQ